jgi:hypothetical protein
MPTGRIFTVDRDAHLCPAYGKPSNAPTTKRLSKKRRNLRTVSIREIWDDARAVVRLPGSL